ncbi:MAG: hypothetical protein H0W53_03950 [Acidobacteria bacterium]|nr:hypothetical protein [Acidobacteriota bacterium]
MLPNAVVIATSANGAEGPPEDVTATGRTAELLVDRKLCDMSAFLAVRCFWQL